MEVKNPAVDQLMSAAVPQAPAGQNAKAPKDVDQPDFDSMVHQKRAAGEKAAAKKDAGASKADAKEPDRDEAAIEEPKADDGQYAVAAALMFQTQPDLRVFPMPEEPETEPMLTAAIPAETEMPAVEAGEAPIVEEPLAELVVETAVEPPEATEEFAVRQPAAEAPEAPEAAEEHIELPEHPREELRPETPDAKAEAPERAREEVRTELRAPQRQEIEAPREERITPRVVRSQAQPEDDAAEDGTPVAQEAQEAQEAPLFAHVEAPVVKVAEAPVPLEAEDGIDRLGGEIGDVLVNSVEANRVEVTLTPQNLGTLTVEITRGEDGTLNVVLHATTERAANLLEKGADGLRQALTANAGREVQVQVRGSEESQRQFLNPDGQNGRQQQQQRQNERRGERRNAQEFLQQLRLGLVGIDEDSE